MSSDVRVVEGELTIADKKVAVVASRFNAFIVDRLVDGAVDALLRHGAKPPELTVIKVPGAWELPLVTQRVVQAKKHDAVVALGALIRGATPHFDYIAAEVSKGLAQVSMQSGIPVAFGVLTTDSIEQAVERAGSKAGNKGAEAAVAVIEMLSLLAKL